MGGLAFVVARSLTEQAVSQSVRLMAVEDTGEYPFTASVSRVSADEVAGVRGATARVGRQASGPDTDRNSPADRPGNGQGDGSGEQDGSGDNVRSPLGSLTTVSAEDRLLYGSRSAPVCNSEALVKELKSDDGVLEAWSDLIGVKPAEVESFISGLTPVVLGWDTAVTNSIYQNGDAREFQAVLQAGTPVLVDEHGLPRVQCSCGNPLGPAEIDPDTPIEFEGDRWNDFEPDDVVAVEPSTNPITVLRTVDIETLETTETPVGPSVVIDGYIVDDTNGVFAVSRAGEMTQLLEDPVDRVFDDGMGGIFFQYPRGNGDQWQDPVYTEPVDTREASIWHLPAGAVEPVAAFKSDEPSSRWYALQGAGLLAGEPVVVYSEVRKGPNQDSDNNMTADITVRNLKSGAETSLVSDVIIYEGSFGPVTMAGNRIAVDTSYDLGAWDVYDSAGTEIPTGCAYPEDGDSSLCESNASLRTEGELTVLHIDETRCCFSVYAVDLSTGEMIAQPGLANALGKTFTDFPDVDESPPRFIDSVGDEVVLSWATGPAADGYPPLPTVSLDVGSGEARQLSFTGRTRVLRAPLLRPAGAKPAIEAELIAPGWDEIANAQIPEVCGHPPTTLVNGRHTAIEEGHGVLELLPTIGDGAPGFIQGLPSHQGVPLTAVVATCNGGGVGWPSELLLFGPGGDFYASSALVEDDEATDWKSAGLSYPGRDGITALAIDGDQLVLTVQAELSSDASCCPSAVAEVRATPKEGQLVIDEIQRID